MSFLRRWDELPKEIRNDAVKPYYDLLKHKTASLFLKRLFDLCVSLVLILLLSPVLVIIAVMIKCDSKGPFIFRQERVTQYGKIFEIFKFRTMYVHEDESTAQLTQEGDSRITKVGHLIRKARVDEFPQLFNVLVGDMSFVGTRPEVKSYVDAYTPEMYATLLLPAGITSRASIKFKDEDEMLSESTDIPKTYIEDILPIKMCYNLQDIREFNIWNDIKIMWQTFLAVLM